jgi:hypothetical protein
MAQAVRPDTSPLRIFDAHGRLVGNVVSLQFENALVSFEYDSIHFTLAVKRNEFTQFSIPSLFYTSNDCSGPAFLLDGGTLFAEVRLVGTTLFVADTRIAAHTGVLKSSGLPESCNPDARTAAVFNAIVFSNFTNQWSPPFSPRSLSDVQR